MGCDSATIPALWIAAATLLLCVILGLAAASVHWRTAAAGSGLHLLPGCCPGLAVASARKWPPACPSSCLVYRW